MTLSRDTLEDLIERFRAVVLKHTELAAEFDGSIADFLPPGIDLGDPKADAAARLRARRHLEWFLFERPSDVVGGVPAEALLTSIEGAPEHAEALLSSLAGVFEVTGVEPERGLWLRDVFGLGEYPVDEPEAATTVQPGDVVVGRVFPAGESVFRLSPAAAVLRNAELLKALKLDVERLREGRRGSLRIAQLEIERMFFGEAEEAAPPADPAALERELRQLLADAGVDAGFTQRLLGELREAARAGRGDAPTSALNRLAFDTEVDLEEARRVIAALWGAWTTPQQAPKPDSDDAESPDAVREALARFDEGRTEGQDLEALFQSLEEDLGLAGGPPEPDQEIAPDFPGVVAAVVEEFLWETGLEHGDELAKRYADLRRLGEFATDVGVFENLSSRHLLEFAGRWVLDRDAVEGGAAAHALMEALSAFCQWSRERQSVDLWTGFEETLKRLSDAVPRLVELRRRRPPVELAGTGEGDGDDGVFRFERARDGRALLVDAQGEAHEVALDEVYGGLLRDGDVVHARLSSDGPRIGACYPAVLFAEAQ